jgi:hypothetical protein
MFEETTIDESVWIARLLEWGIVPEVDEQGELSVITDGDGCESRGVGAVTVSLESFLRCSYLLFEQANRHTPRRAERLARCRTTEHVEKFSDVIS